MNPEYKSLTPFTPKTVFFKVLRMLIIFCFVFFIVAILSLATIQALGY